MSVTHTPAATAAHPSSAADKVAAARIPPIPPPTIKAPHTATPIAPPACRTEFSTREATPARDRGNHYSGVTRYTTSAFLRMDLRDALAQRNVAPHICESTQEAHERLRRCRSKADGRLSEN